MSMFSSSRKAGSKPEDAERNCANPLWLFFFLVALGYITYAYTYAVQHGSLLELTGLPDGQGLVCGVSSPVAEKPFLYLCPSQGEQKSSDLVCVAQCPISIEGSVAKSVCTNSPASDYPSIPVAGKVCFPTDASRYKQLVKLSFQIGLESFLAAIVEIQKAWPVLILSGLAAIVLSYIYLAALSRSPSTTFWISTTLFTVVMGAMGIYTVCSTVNTAVQLGDPWDVMSNPEFIIAAVVSICVLCFYFTILYDRGDIEAAFTAIEAVAECGDDVPALYTEPLIGAARKTILLLVFITGLLYFVSDFDRVLTTDAATGGTSYTIQYEPMPVLIAVGYVLGFMWLFEFSRAMSCFVYSYIAETWFYSPLEEDTGMKDMKISLLFEAYWVLVRYSLGSLAYGSFVLMITRPLRDVFDYCSRPVRKEQTSNPCYRCANKVSCWGGVCDRCTSCYEDYFRPLRKSAFMDVAMNGKDFWDAKTDADWFLSGQNVAMSEMDGAAALIATAGSFCVASCGAGITRILCAAWPDYSTTSSPNYIMLPTFVSVVSFLVCYVFSHNFLMMPDFVADSIFFCFCVDQKAYGIGKSAEEREAMNQPGCNIQSLWGSSGTTPATSFVRGSHPPKTMELYETFTSLA